MSAREIPANQWPGFLDQFSRDHRAWLATVERVHPGSPAHAEALERPLAAVVPHAAGNRITRIDISFQDSRAREPVHVDAPARIRVDETVAGVVRSLEIVDYDGECTRVRFRAAPMPETLDGIAPAEWPSP